VKEKGIRYVTAFRDNTNYINAAKKGIGIFEMGQSMTAQDREEWKPLISWLKTKRK
jgi:chromosome partitioning protein